MWCNPWVIKELFGVFFGIIMIGGACYFGMYAFAKVSFEIKRRWKK